MILIDTPNLYHNVKDRYNANIHYDTFLDLIENNHGELRKIAYISQVPNHEKFKAYFESLENTSINLKREEDFSIELTIDAMRYEFDELVICSANKTLAPLLRALKIEHINVTVYACNIPREFRQHANCNEIDTDVLSVRQSCN